MKKILTGPVLGLLLLLVPLWALSESSDLTKIRQRVVAELMAPMPEDSRVRALLETQEEQGTWAGINYQDVSREAFEHRVHLGNMVTLSRAYKTKASKFYKSRKVKQSIIKALSFWVENDFICDNWWHNQIGTPNSLVSLMLIIGKELPEDLVTRAQPIIGRAHINAPGARPGGDRIKIASIQAKNMLFIDDQSTFDKVVNVIENEIKYVEWIGREYGYTYRLYSGGFSNRSSGGRGIQYGNSFHHRTDGVNNTLSYGLSYASAFIEWAVYTEGTKYAFAEDKLDRLIDYYLDGICKTAVFGKFPDPGAKNRSVCRRGTLRAYGADAAEKLLQTTDYRKTELEEIAAIRKTGIHPTVSHATFFWNTEHFSFQRPNWFTSVRMYSTRNHNMEVPYNSEGLLNHHRGDGANHISRTGDEYYDIFPVFDYQKVPGATVMQKAELPAPNEIQKLGQTQFVGAVTDGLYGAVAFDFKSPHDPLIARKSWFFFDDEYVCLGAGISCKSELPVVTTINQCLLRDEVVISKDGKRMKIEPGEKQQEQVDWVFHDGIGYVFPTSKSIHLKNNEAKGSWWRISKQSTSSKETVSEDIFSLWLDHGKRPSDETYEYLVVPATSIEQLETQHSKKNIRILSNTPLVQAVENQALGIIQVVFYQAGEVVFADGMKLMADNPGIVMLKTTGNRVSELSVADPNRELSKFHLSLSSKIEQSGEGFHSSWDEVEKRSHIVVEMPKENYAGDSVTIKL